MEKAARASLLLIIVLGLGLVYVGDRVNSLDGRVDELDYSIIETGVSIDNGSGAVTETVHLTRGATGLEALHRVADVGTDYYTGMGVLIRSINGISNEDQEGMNWIYYVWENGGWVMPMKGAGNYRLEEGDNIMFSYEESPF